MLAKNIDKYSFQDLFDMDKVQKLTDAISMALEVGVVIVSPEGEPITKPSNFGNFCLNVVRKSPIGYQNCLKSDAELSRLSDEPIVSKCLSAGLTDAGISIVIGGKHIASWMIGQVMLEDDMLSEEEMRERARRLGIDEKLFIESIKEVPVRTREQFDRMIKMIKEIALQLSELGLKNFMQKEELAHKKVVEEELRGQNAKLEDFHKYDKLTGLFSRAYYEECLKKIVENKEYPIVLISGDMNNLKLYNDVFGHQHGDKSLRILGEILRNEARDGFVMGRCGGDEFCVAIPRGRVEMAEEYCKRIHSACNTADAMIPPSIALGYFVLESEDTTLEYATRQADEAMYNAKMKKKHSENIQRDIMEILYRKQYLSEKQINITVKRIGRFGKFLGLDEYAIQVLKLAAKLQDVGLIGVPEAVVKKETKRTEEEYAQLAKHPEIGYRLARLYDESLPAADIILQSHECWFGKGYPNQLKGKEILHSARVLYMVTNYSHWIAPKPTGSNMKSAEARKRLVGESGKMFDPDLVDKFLRYLEKKEPLR